MKPECVWFFQCLCSLVHLPLSFEGYTVSSLNILSHPGTYRYIPSHEGTRITIIYGEELNRLNSSPKKSQIGLSTHDFSNDGFGVRVDFAIRFISSLADFKAT
jgi:hypothetical protein